MMVFVDMVKTRFRESCWMLICLREDYREHSNFSPHDNKTGLREPIDELTSCFGQSSTRLKFFFSE
jgi:hypothetical protein